MALVTTTGRRTGAYGPGYNRAQNWHLWPWLQQGAELAPMALVTVMIPMILILTVSVCLYLWYCA